MTEAEYSNSHGHTIINDLITKYCITKDPEIKTSISLTDIYGVAVKYEGDVKLHGKKVYQIVHEMCQSYGHDLWSSTTWLGDDIDIKKISGSSFMKVNKNVKHIFTKFRSVFCIHFKTDN